MSGSALVFAFSSPAYAADYVSPITVNTANWSGNGGYGSAGPTWFEDSTGTGALAQALTDQAVTFTADAAVFSAPNVGSVIRMGGGIAR